MTITITETTSITMEEVKVITITDEEIASATYTGPVQWALFDKYIAWCEEDEKRPEALREWNQSQWKTPATRYKNAQWCFAGKVAEDHGHFKYNKGEDAEMACPDFADRVLGLDVGQHRYWTSFSLLLSGNAKSPDGKLRHTNLYYGRNTVQDLKNIRDVIADREGYPRKYNAADTALV